MTLILRGNQFCKSIALKRSFTKQHIYDTFIALGWITVSEIIMKTNVKQKDNPEAQRIFFTYNEIAP